MPSLDAIVAGGGTALGYSLIVFWLLVTEQLVPKGRLAEVKEQLKECKDALREALAIIKEQNDGTQPLVTIVKELVSEVKMLLARGRR
jgi:hypothetical protein